MVIDPAQSWLLQRWRTPKANDSRYPLLNARLGYINPRFKDIHIDSMEHVQEPQTASFLTTLGILYPQMI